MNTYSDIVFPIHFILTKDIYEMLYDVIFRVVNSTGTKKIKVRKLIQSFKHDYFIYEHEANGQTHLSVKAEKIRIYVRTLERINNKCSNI